MHADFLYIIQQFGIQQLRVCIRQIFSTDWDICLHWCDCVASSEYYSILCFVFIDALLPLFFISMLALDIRSMCCGRALRAAMSSEHASTVSWMKWPDASRAARCGALREAILRVRCSSTVAYESPPVRLKTSVWSLLPEAFTIYGPDEVCSL